MPLDNPKAYMKGNGYGNNPGPGRGSAVLMAKGKMADLLKRMMAAKLKAKLGKAMGVEEESEEMESEEPKSEENAVPEEELKALLEMYGKLK